MLLNASVINGAVLNGGVGDYKILLGSIVSNATLGQVPVLLIKPFNSSISISTIASGYDSVNWVLAANVSVTATDSGYLYKTSVLDGIDGQVTSTVYGSLSKSDLLNTSINTAVTTSNPLLTSLISFESLVDVSTELVGSILKIDSLGSNIFVAVNQNSILNKIDKLSGNVDFNSSIEEHFFKVVKNISTTINTNVTTESILSLIINMDSDIICNAIISKDDLFISKNLAAIEAILAIITNAHLKHLYTHFGLEVKTDTTNIEISDINVDYLDTEDTTMIGINYERTIY